MRAFACGELGWTLDRWRHSTLPEFNMAVDGYWKNWERSTAWLMRELVFTLVNGNPYIKNGKPSSSKEIIKISDDSREMGEQEHKKVSPEELAEAKKLLMGIRDNLTKK
jgi:hypothetical protein